MAQSDKLKKGRTQIQAEMESDDFSLETTVPTDISFSDELSEIMSRRHQYGDVDVKKRKNTVDKHRLLRKQMAHDIQLLKIELSQKSLMIDSMKAEHMQKVEDLEEGMNEAIHQKNIVQARFQSQSQIEQDEARRRQQQIQHELSGILERQQQLEATNERLQEKAVDLRKNLDDLDLTEARYTQLKLKNEDDLALKDFVAMRLFESLWPWQQENSELKTRVRSVSDELHRNDRLLQEANDALEDEKRTHASLQLAQQKMVLAYADVKLQVKTGDYKVENYDLVKRQHDEYEQELAEVKRQLGFLQTTHEVLSKERQDQGNELSTARQSVELLRQDKEFFAKQAGDLHSRLLYTEERLMAAHDGLERAKQSREQLYDKYVASRDQHREEYESKLRGELDQIRSRTDTEVDRLKTTCRDAYERENRSLREGRDMAVSERDRAVTAEQDACTKYEQLMQEYRRVQLSSDSSLADVHSSLKLKAFEASRTQIAYDETLTKMNDCHRDNEKLQKKLEVLTREYYDLQATHDRRVAELTARVDSLSEKLTSYEKLEVELDAVVMQSAEVDNEDDAERVLFSYGYGANVPTTSRRRLKQSVELARRVLQLERANTSLRSEVDRQQTKNAELAAQLKSSDDLLAQSQQPYHYLVESVRTRDTQIDKQKEHVQLLEADVRQLQQDKIKLSKAKNLLTTDLERVLSQKEEMAVLKQTVLSLSRRGLVGRGPCDVRLTQTARRRPTPKSVIHKKSHNATAADELGAGETTPAPVLFTVKGDKGEYKQKQESLSRLTTYRGSKLVM